MKKTIRNAEQSAPALPNGWRVMLCASEAKRDGDRWEVYSPDGSGGVVSTHDVRDWVVRGLLDALAEQGEAEAAQSAPAGEQPAPYGWVAAGQFFAAREDAVDAAEKTPCVEVYSRPQVLAILDRSAERQTLAEELARQLRQTCDELRALKSAPAVEREAFRAAHRELDLSEKPDAWGRSQFLHSHVEVTWRGFQAGAAWQRTQAAGVPDGWRDLLRRARRFVEDWDDDSQEFMDLCGEIDNALAAAPAQPAAHDQSEVQRLREDAARYRALRDHGRHPIAVRNHLSHLYHESLDAAVDELIAASTGQEVGK